MPAQRISNILHAVAYLPLPALGLRLCCASRPSKMQYEAEQQLPLATL